MLQRKGEGKKDWGGGGGGGGVGFHIFLPEDNLLNGVRFGSLQRLLQRNSIYINFNIVMVTIMSRISNCCIWPEAHIIDFQIAYESFLWVVCMCEHVSSCVRVCGWSDVFDIRC
jgi:hypothetical protein